VIACYDTLDDMRWIPSKGVWRKRGQGVNYVESKEPCPTCGLYFLHQERSKGIFCCGWCRSKHIHKQNPSWCEQGRKAKEKT
jgi:hypothetical protein